MIHSRAVLIEEFIVSPFHVYIARYIYFMGIYLNVRWVEVILANQADSNLDRVFTKPYFPMDVRPTLQRTRADHFTREPYIYIQIHFFQSISTRDAICIY